mmetsp:Transcript_22933/g.68702  ORF Transcript_22933/g.68702 Transcript_22933/m.68702 type:complete len:319 (-) Transcript_22933:332-1288(-)
MVGTAACGPPSRGGSLAAFGPPSRGGPPGLGSRCTQRRRRLRARRLARRPRRDPAEPGSGYNVYGDRHSLLGGTSSDVFLRGGIRECIRTFGIETYVPQAPCGVPQIEVTFDIDANGILYVSDGGRGTGKEQTITGSPTQDKADVERRVQDAGDNDAEDDKRKESVETRNNVESLVYRTEKRLQDLGDWVPADLVSPFDPKLVALKEKVAEAGPDGEKKMTQELQEELMKIGQDPLGGGRDPLEGGQDPLAGFSADMARGPSFEEELRALKDLMKHGASFEEASEERMQYLDQQGMIQTEEELHDYINVWDVIWRYVG